MLSLAVVVTVISPLLHHLPQANTSARICNVLSPSLRRVVCSKLIATLTPALHASRPIPLVLQPKHNVTQNALHSRLPSPTGARALPSQNGQRTSTHHICSPQQHQAAASPPPLPGPVTTCLAPSASLAPPRGPYTPYPPPRHSILALAGVYVDLDIQSSLHRTALHHHEQGSHALLVSCISRPIRR